VAPQEVCVCRSACVDKIILSYLCVDRGGGELKVLAVRTCTCRDEIDILSYLAHAHAHVHALAHVHVHVHVHVASI
jgi:hypothetical protein